MKWPKDQIEIYKNAVAQVIESTGKSAEEIRKEYAFAPTMRIMFEIDRIVCYDAQYDNNHPAYHETIQDGKTFKARIRRCKHNPDFVLYPRGCDDTHKATMLRHVGTELGLILRKGKK
jgi:hypothetical protein